MKTEAEVGMMPTAGRPPQAKENGDLQKLKGQGNREEACPYLDFTPFQTSDLPTQWLKTTQIYCLRALTS